MGKLLGRKVYRQVRLDNGEYEFVELDNPPPPTSSDLMFQEPFRSPVDGSIIRNKRELMAHNRRHGVIQQLPGLDQDVSAKRKEAQDLITGPVGKQERREALLRALEKSNA